MYRQGDVWLEKVEMEQGLKVKQSGKQLTLALGELTGHAHVLTGSGLELLEDGNGNTYVRVSVESKMTHGKHTGNEFLSIHEKLEHEDRHKSFTVKPGIYKVFIEREHNYLDKVAQKVVD